MTAIDLLNALKAYTEDKVKDMRLITRVPENGTDPGERPPLVFIGNLPNKEQEKKAAPYILLKLLTKKVDDEENVCRVRIICVTFSEDKNENYMQCLNLVTKIETNGKGIFGCSNVEEQEQYHTAVTACYMAQVYAWR